MKTLKNSNGFSILHLLLTIVVIGLIGCAGWYVWSSNHKDDKKASNSSSKKISTTDKKKETSIPSKEYRNNEYGFTFQYPENWIFKDDSRDIGRDAMEGDISVTSPNGTIVTFNINQGGKGGDCGDPAANYERTANSCNTEMTLSLEPFDSGIVGRKMYIQELKITPATNKGGSPYYRVGLTDDHDRSPSIGSSLTEVDLDIISARGVGNIDIKVAGNDDSKNGSAQFLHTTEAREARQILKTFRLIP